MRDQWRRESNPRRTNNGRSKRPGRRDNTEEYDRLGNDKARRLRRRTRREQLRELEMSEMDEFKGGR